jgi:hypothetical protein
MAVPVGRRVRDIFIERNPGMAYAVVNLGTQKRFMAAAVGFQGPSDHFFPFSSSINVTGIKQIDTGIQGTVQHLG